MPEHALLDSARNEFASQWRVLLVWSCLLLLPFGRTVEISVFAMAFWGIYLTARGRLAFLKTPPVKLFTAAFLCLWIPVLLSLIDAYNVQRTLVIALNHWRFYFSGLFIIWALSTPESHHRFQMLCGWLLAFWVVDAIVQAILGFDLLGIPPSALGTTGVFGSNAKFAATLAVMTPFLWHYARQTWPGWLVALLVPLTVFAVLGGGSRAAWVMLVVVIVCLVILGVVRSRRSLIAWSAASVLALSLIAVLAYQSSPPFRGRIDMTVAELTGQHPGGSLNHRAYIWKASWRMFLDNPIIGVGARGFRYAFADYSLEDDPFYHGSSGVTPSHSHNLITELATETGIIGLAGAALIVILLVRAGWRTRNIDALRMTPYGVALIAANFPLNTHWAIFSSYWSQVVWWLIALYCALYGAKRGCETHPAPVSIRRSD